MELGRRLSLCGERVLMRLFRLGKNQREGEVLSL